MRTGCRFFRLRLAYGVTRPSHLEAPAHLDDERVLKLGRHLPEDALLGEGVLKFAVC